MSSDGRQWLLLWNEGVAGCRGARGVPYRYSFSSEQYRRRVASTGVSMHVQCDGNS